MTALPPDPDPSSTTGLARGGGIEEPGDTPPDSGSLSASANPTPVPRRKFTPAVIAVMIAIGVFILIFLTVAVIYGLQLAG